MHAEAGHFAALPQPDRVGSNTRAALLKRGALDDPGCADMNSFETCLSEMYRKSIITRESAEKYAPDPSRLTLDSSQR